MKHTLFALALPLAALALKRAALLLWWRDTFGGIAAWQWHAWGGVAWLTLLLTSAAVCGGVLLVNWICFELPANRRMRKTRP